MRTLGPIVLLASVVSSAVFSFALPQTVHAGGLFYAGSGTRPLGRGAAYHVRADDGLALSYNPAKLADLEGMQFLANFNLALLDACMDPAGTAGRGVPQVAKDMPTSQEAGIVRDRGTYKENYDAAAADVTRFGYIPAGASNKDLRKSWIGTTMPKVCNETAMLPIPNFVFSYQFIKHNRSWPANGLHGLTVAFGMVTPGAVAQTNWGNKSNGTVSAKGHASAKQVNEATKDGGERLPAGVRPDVICNPATDPDGCSQYCDPEKGNCDKAQYFCDPSKYDCNKLPTPTRYMLVDQDPIAIPLTLGIGYRPLPWLAVGGAFTYQAIFFKSTVYSTQGTQSIPENDMKVENELNDWFVPVALGSLQVTPMQGLEFMSYFKWQGAIAGDTKVTITDGTYRIGGREGGLPVKTVIKAGDGVVTEVPQPWEAGGGVRFALPRTGYYRPFEPTSRQDAMTHELFDIEFDFVLEHNSTIKEFTLRSNENAFRVFQGYDEGDTNFDGATSPTDPKCNTNSTLPAASAKCTGELRFLKKMGIKRAWKDQFVYRVGGDFNVIPGVLALRAGWNLETRGVSPSYQSIDAFPSRRMGFHGGLTWRIGSIDLSLAYAHLFQETINVLHADAVDSNGKLTSDRAGLPASPLDPASKTINAGTYRVSWDVFSIGMNQRF